ncbi:MAG: hypothetical protein K8S14_10795, partial [Actinomycetia bacterium]|nr:hypothetical protein [Actinomycetes bacterium]
TVAKMLSRQGHQSLPIEDLCKTASKAAHTFNTAIPVSDCLSSRYAAVLAGLGQMGWSGCVITPEFGLRQRFVAIVTDVPLEPTPLYDGNPLCKKCFRCVDACPVKAVEILSKVVDDGRKSAAYPWCCNDTSFQQGKEYATCNRIQLLTTVYQVILLAGRLILPATSLGIC